MTLFSRLGATGSANVLPSDTHGQGPWHTLEQAGAELEQRGATGFASALRRREREPVSPFVANPACTPPTSRGGELQSAFHFPLSAFIFLWLITPLCAAPPWPSAPSGDDYTHTSLRRYQQELTAHYGTYRDIPLDVKADYFTWELWRYHTTSFDQVYNHVLLPDQPGGAAADLSRSRQFDVGRFVPGGVELRIRRQA